jgi:hypothetical protein
MTDAFQTQRTAGTDRPAVAESAGNPAGSVAADPVTILGGRGERLGSRGTPNRGDEPLPAAV